MAETEKLRKDADICLSDIKDETENKKKKEKEPRIPKVGPIELFKFADKIDVTLIIFGTLTSIGHGVIMPVMCALFGEMTDNFADHTALAEYNTTLFNSTSINHNVTLGDFMSKFAIYYSILGAIVIVTAFAEIAFFTLSAGRQVRRIRIRCFHSILRQDIGWFDVTETGTLNTHIIDDVYKIQEGIGEQIGLFIQSLSTFVFSFVVSLIKGWKLTLVILAVCPLLGLTAALFSQMVTSFTTKEQAAYAKAGAVAEEVLSAIRTVFAFNGQHKEINRYHNNLEEAKKMGIKATISTSLIMGFTFMMIYLSYALAFWYGSTLILTQEYSVGTVLSVLFALLIGASALGHTSPAIQSFSGARGAAYKIYSIIANKPTIDSYSESGFKPDSINGNLEFKNVHFTYPSRPDVKVLNNLSLSVKTGQTVALVGSSGCGKSTTIQLLQRFYELQEGSISIDGHDICSLNVRYLRGIIGVVSQEPVLFATTISENIRYGRLDVTQEEIEAAAKEANAYDFIVSLPDKFETLVGDRGTQMSGGQKQRIAIARALVRNPKILLLDEATSALDAQSETIVQAALDKVRLGRTTIVVAHRLSTIRNADVIAGFKNGEVVEFGTHSELMEKQGVYHTLVTMQTFEKAKDEEQEESVPVENCPIAQKPVESSLIMRKSTRGSSNAGLEGKKEEKETLVDAKNIIDDDESLPPVSFCTIMRFNLGEWPYILFGTIFAILNGIVMPMFEIILSKYIVVFIDPDEEVVRNKSLILSIIFAVLGVASFFTLFFEAAVYFVIRVSVLANLVKF
ncbi:ATP-dependent translocase ABCB1-like [Stigmatopora argus]